MGTHPYIAASWLHGARIMYFSKAVFFVTASAVTQHVPTNKKHERLFVIINNRATT